MKTLNTMRVMPALLALALGTMLAVPAMAAAAQPVVRLGTTSGFAILAGQGITNDPGVSTIAGTAGANVGSYPNPAITGEALLTFRNAGAVLTGSVVRDAQTDLVTAFNDAAAPTPDPIPVELGGVTLTPGVYGSVAGFQISAGQTLTLDARGDSSAVFIFNTADSALDTFAGSRVSLINGAQHCKVYWKVGSTATLGENSFFEGRIFALTSIVAQTGATVHGQLLARNGSVTLDTVTITNDTCRYVVPTPVTPTETGGELPTTSTPWYNLLLAGVVLAVVGAAGFWKTTRRIHE